MQVLHQGLLLLLFEPPQAPGQKRNQQALGVQQRCMGQQCLILREGPSLQLILQLHLLGMLLQRHVQLGANCDSIEHLRLDLRNQQQQPHPGKLGVGSIQALRNVRHFADEKHVEDAKDRHEAKNGAHLAEHLLLQHVRLRTVLRQLREVGHCNVEDGAKHANEYKSIDALHCRVPENSHVLGLRVGRVHVQNPRMLQKACAEKAKNQAGEELKGHRQFQVHLICRKL
mmetsp:Transcript_72293/g.172638  ORF Transcript_72293/g.172638 Transcript_72293/m.172638 type:complete len:228 (+) Transcript_72293:89-772(+)